MIYGKVEFGRNFSSAKREEKLRPPSSDSIHKPWKSRAKRGIFQEKNFSRFLKILYANWALCCFEILDFENLQKLTWKFFKCWSDSILIISWKNFGQFLENFSSFDIMVSILDHPQGLVEKFWLFISIIQDFRGLIRRFWP